MQRIKSKENFFELEKIPNEFIEKDIIRIAGEIKDSQRRAADYQQLIG